MSSVLSSLCFMYLFINAHSHVVIILYTQLTTLELTTIDSLCIPYKMYYAYKINCPPLSLFFFPFVTFGII